MAPTRAIDQLRCDQHLLPHFPYTTFQDVPYPHFSTNLLDLHSFALVGKGGVTGDDKEAGELGEVRRDVLGDAVTEILLLRVIAHIGKGENDDGGFVRKRKR